MNLSQIEAVLKNIEQLPGWEVQKELSPPGRGEFTWDEIYNKNPRKSSVLITLYAKEDKIYFPLILRSIYKGVHSGQIGLPGGKEEEYDISLQETALRETYEELGLSRNKLIIEKKLTPLYIPPSNFYVEPYIAFYKEENVIFDVNKEEVQKVFEIDLHKFVYETLIVKEEVLNRNKDLQRVPAFRYDNITIWGATAMILNEFSYLIKAYNNFLK